MSYQVLLIMLLAASAYAIPRRPIPKEELAIQPYFGMPGPVILQPNNQDKPDEADLNSINASPQCQICELVMKELDSLITQNSTQEEIEDALEKVCGYLPSSYKSECDALVKQYTPAILELLANEISPAMICSSLGLCSSSNTILLDDKEGNNTLCDMCLEIMGLAKKLIEENDTEAQLEKALKLICWYMLPIKSECDSFIDHYIPLVFDELKKLDPETVCKQIKACPSQFVDDIRCFLRGPNVCNDLELSKKCGVKCNMVEGKL